MASESNSNDHIVGEKFLLDVNLLIALITANHSHHRSAHNWFAGITTWAMTPMTESSLIRLALNPEVMGEQLSTAAVLSTVSMLRKQPGFVFLNDESSLTDSIFDDGQFFGYKQVTDFHLINLAAKNGYKFATFDYKLKKSLQGDSQEVVTVVPVLS